jgi:hypothetical protein
VTFRWAGVRAETLSMAFWSGVLTAYAVVVALGLAVGSLLAARFPRRGGDGGSDAQPVAPYGGPSAALDVPPLGSAFDRLLLPGVFDALSPSVFDAEPASVG